MVRFCILESRPASFAAEEIGPRKSRLHAVTVSYSDRMRKIKNTIFVMVFRGDLRIFLVIPEQFKCRAGSSAGPALPASINVACRKLLFRDSPQSRDRRLTIDGKELFLETKIGSSVRVIFRQVRRTNWRRVCYKTEVVGVRISGIIRAARTTCNLILHH